MTNSSDRSRLRGYLFIVLIGAVSWRTGPVWAQADHPTLDLRPRFVQGRTTKYHVWSNRQQFQSVAIGPRNREFETRFEIEGEITWTVNRVRQNQSATCSMTIQWMTAQYTGPDGKTQHSDSRKSRGLPESIHGLLRAMMGMPVIIEVEPDGSVRSAKGIDAIRRSAPKDANVPDERDFIESASDLATIVGAAANVAIDDQWKTQLDTNHQFGLLHQSMRLTLSSVETIADIPVATVTGIGRLEFEPDKDLLPKMPSRDWKVRARMTNGQIVTQVMFDLQRREAVGRNTMESRVIEIDVRGPQQSFKRTIDEQIHSQVLRVAEE